MKLKFLLAGAILLTVSVGSVNAQVRQHTKNQHARIKQGVKSGELTKHEAKNLAGDQKEIRQEVKAAKSDGVVTAAEKKDIRHDQRRESKKIYRKKHNEKERGE